MTARKIETRPMRLVIAAERKIRINKSARAEGEISPPPARKVMAARRLLRRWAAMTLRAGGGEISPSALALLLILIFLSAAITNLIGLVSIFRAVIIGSAMSDQHA